MSIPPKKRSKEASRFAMIVWQLLATSLRRGVVMRESRHALWG